MQAGGPVLSRSSRSLCIILGFRRGELKPFEMAKSPPYRANARLGLVMYALTFCGRMPRFPGSDLSLGTVDRKYAARPATAGAAKDVPSFRTHPSVLPDAH